MNSAKNLSLVVLSLVAIGAAVLAWQQRAELQALRAAAGNDDRDELRRRTAAAEKRAKDLADQLAAAQEKVEQAAKSVAVKTDNPKAGAERGGSGGGGDNLRTAMTAAANLMNRPEMQRMMAMGQKAALDTNYAKLFKQLNLSPEKLEDLKKLMVERQTVGSDVFSAAIQQGLDPVQNRAEIRKLTADGQAKVDGEIKSLLGDGDYASYQNYNATLPQRNIVNQLQNSLSYTQTPLTEAQGEQLVQILAANPVARPAAVRTAGAPGTGGGPDGGQNVTSTRTMVFAGGDGVGGGANFVAPVVGGAPALIGGAQISEAAVTASSSVLSSPQLAALQQMQQQQAQMRAMMQQPGGMAMPMNGGVIRIESSTSSGPADAAAHPPAGGKPPGGE